MPELVVDGDTCHGVLCLFEPDEQENYSFYGRYVTRWCICRLDCFWLSFTVKLVLYTEMAIIRIFLSA